MFFEQEHVPGREGAFDFTDCSSLRVTITGQFFAHLLFQFILSFSKWCYVALAFSETFEALVAGLQGALWDGHGLVGALECHARVRRSWGTLTRSFIRRFERLRAELLWLRGRAALAYAERNTRLRRTLLQEAAGCAARLLRESAPWAAAAGHLVQAGVHEVRGERPAAEDRLQRAVGLAQSCGMSIIGCAHRDDRVLSQVKRPDRWVRMIATGLSTLGD